MLCRKYLSAYEDLRRSLSSDAMRSKFRFVGHGSHFKNRLIEMYKKRKDFRMAGSGHGIEGAAKHHHYLASK